jgi:hypothetical protein
MKLLPAPSGTGIVFRRTDLDGFLVEAHGSNVAKVSYATSLMKKGVLISTTEHLLSALVGIGVDNAFVELDNLELPILDASACVSSAANGPICAYCRRSSCAKGRSSSLFVQPTTTPLRTRSIFRTR